MYLQAACHCLNVFVPVSQHRTGARIFHMGYAAKIWLTEAQAAVHEYACFENCLQVGVFLHKTGLVGTLDLERVL